MCQHVGTVISKTSITFAIDMNTNYNSDYAKYYPRQWLRSWLAQLRRLRGSLTFLHTLGGLNPRYTNIDPVPAPEKYDIVKFMRVMSAMCEYMDEKEFVDFGTDRLREFYQFNKKHGKTFREQYKRKK